MPMPASRCVVAIDMNFLSPEPLTACRPSDKCFIPSKNVPSPPPTITNTNNISFMSPILLKNCENCVSATTARRKNHRATSREIPYTKLQIQLTPNSLPFSIEIDDWHWQHWTLAPFFTPSLHLYTEKETSRCTEEALLRREDSAMTNPKGAQASARVVPNAPPNIGLVTQSFTTKAIRREKELNTIYSLLPHWHLIR